MIEDFFPIAIRNLTHRRLRSWLTVLGIFIGIAAVVGLISISEGLQEAIEAQFEMLGADTITIMPGQFGMGPPGMGAEPFTDREVEVIERVRGVDTVVPMFFRSSLVGFGGEEKYVYVIGLPPDKAEEVIIDMGGLHLVEGRIPHDSAKYDVVLGNLFMDGLFERNVRVGNTIEISGAKFRVAGILSKVGNPSDDSQVYIHMDTARELFQETDEVTYIFLNVKKGYDPDKVAEDIKEELEDYRGEEDFSVLTTTQLSEVVDVVLGLMQLVLVGIAAISLLVGGVGIMNTMYTSVRDRTREIGIMKAIGATNLDIMLIFLVESGILGLVGGAIGVALGLMLAIGVEYAAIGYGFTMLKAHVGLGLILLALGFSFIAGVISGVLPARSAAKLRPVDALRYE